MTTLVCFDETLPKGRWRRFWSRMSGKRVVLSAERAAGASYCLVTAKTFDGVPWPEVEEAVGRGGLAVFPKGTSLPAGLGVNRVDGEPLRRRILLNGAVWALEQAASAGDVGEIALLDREGRFSSLVPRLMQSCRALTVVTAHTEEYHRLGERLFGMLGVAPMVVDRADGLSGCRAVLAPEGLSGFGALEKPPMLFSSQLREGLSLTADDIQTPFSRTLLERYDPYELLTAFRGERLFRDVGNLVPHSMTEGARRLSMPEIAARFAP